MIARGIEGYSRNVNCFTFLGTRAAKEERGIERSEATRRVSGIPSSPTTSPLEVLLYGDDMRRIVAGVMIATLVFAVVLLVVPPVLQKYTERQRSLQSPPTQGSATFGTLRVGSSTVEVELARSPFAWARGLSGRDSLPQERGMLFVFPVAEPREFWMKDTRMPLYMIWIREGTVVGVTADVQPEPGVADVALRPYPSPGNVDQVLEVNAGWAAARGVKIGDAVRLE